MYWLQMYLILLFRLFIYRPQIVKSLYGVYVKKLLLCGLKEIKYMHFVGLYLGSGM